MPLPLTHPLRVGQEGFFVSGIFLGRHMCHPGRTPWCACLLIFSSIRAVTHMCHRLQQRLHIALVSIVVGAPCLCAPPVECHSINLNVSAIGTKKNLSKRTVSRRLMSLPWCCALSLFLWWEGRVHEMCHRLHMRSQGGGGGQQVVFVWWDGGGCTKRVTVTRPVTHLSAGDTSAPGLHTLLHNVEQVVIQPTAEKVVFLEGKYSGKMCTQTPMYLQVGHVEKRISLRVNQLALTCLWGPFAKWVHFE